MRYCNKCGKAIEYDSPICVECVERAKRESLKSSYDAGFYTYSGNSSENYRCRPLINETATKYSMQGFGKALTSAILGFFGFVFAIIEVFSIMFYCEESMFVMFFITAPASVVSLVFGIKSVNLYCRAQNNKPLVAFILGLFGTVMSGLAILIITFIII